MDRDYERPKGTAFIQFENAQSALDACAESNILEHDQRKLYIDLAISRTQASDLVNEKKEKEPQDNRNLALAKEGAVYANSYEAEGVSKSDLDKRNKIEASNNSKLKLLHYFVSTTRLSVHNIPIKCSDLELKKIFLNALNENKFDEEINKKNSRKLIDCRIMRDLTRVNSEGVAKAKGFGFVEFSKFEDSLKALRATNNNPNLFSDKKTRLIVQFSIEDKRALQKKAKRLEKEQYSLDRNIKKKNVHLSLIKSKLTKKSKKKVFDANNNEENEEDIAKKKEKNLIRTHMIENKIEKRKLIEQNKKIKVENKAKRAKLSKDVIEQDDKKAELIAIERKRKRNQLKRERAKNKASKPQKTDNVDRLVDKYLNEKSKKKRKWYE
jgi:nucleolar protein 4